MSILNCCNNLSDRQRIRIYYLAIGVVFILAFAFRAHYLGEKRGFHVDEAFSIIISEYNEIGWTKPIPSGSYTGAELKALVLETDPSISDALSDIALLWRDSRDQPHTNFYYSLLRVSLIGHSYSSLEGLIARAGVLNLIIFTITFFAFLSMVKKIFHSKKIIILALFVAFLNAGEISNSMFFRPYMLQILFFILATSYTISLAEQIKRRTYQTTWQNLLKFSTLFAFLFLTGYYSFLYAFFLAIYVLYLLIKNDQSRTIYFFATGFIIAVAFDFLLYPKFYQVVDHNHATQMLGNNNYSSFVNGVIVFIKYYIKTLINIVYCIPLTCVVGVSAVLSLCTKGDFRKLKGFAVYFISIFIFSIVVLYLSKYKVIRYATPTLAILSLLVPFIIDAVNKRLYRDILCIAACIATVVPIFQVSNIQYLHNNRKEGDKFFANETALFEVDNKDIPIYITSLNGVSYTTHFDDSQNIIVCSTEEDLILQSQGKECYVMLLDEGLKYLSPDQPDLD